MGRRLGHRYGERVVGQVERPVCACGKPVRRLSARSSGHTQRLLAYWGVQCTSCHRAPYRRHLGACCAHCGFVALHPAQYDVDHIDGDHDNNDPANLQTLCANCHRLKTVLAGDHLRGRVERVSLVAESPQLRML